jgi:outer membrane protein OmpA-like peptidoglycan-associated protein
MSAIASTPQRLLAPPPANRHTSEYVRWVQLALNTILGRHLVIDGVAGNQTRKAIVDFQQGRGLVADGLVGPITERAIIDALSVPRVTPTPPGIPTPRPQPGPGTPEPGDSSARCTQPAGVLSRFGFDSDRLTEGHRARIELIAETIVAGARAPSPVSAACMVGHTDSTGNEQFNVQLGMRRANNVRVALSEAIERRSPGMSRQVELVTTSRGERAPIASNASSSGRAENRRVEVFLDAPDRTRPIDRRTSVTIERLSLDRNEESIPASRVGQPGRQVTFVATGSPLPVGTPAYTWTTANASIATVATSNAQTHPNQGVVTGVAPGVTTITVEYRSTVGSAAADVEVGVVDPDEYLPIGGRLHVPTSDAASFRCAPSPVEVLPARRLPASTSTPDDAMRGALGTLGVSNAQISTFETQDGFAQLRPIAAMFGETPLVGLLRRLRYGAGLIRRPAMTFRNDAQLRTNRAIGRGGVLAPRALLAVPAHFRELARRAPDATEAYSLENIGWLLMALLRDQINTATGTSWWVPPAPTFVGAFAARLPGFSGGVIQLINAHNLTDASVTEAAFDARRQDWENGLPGQQWLRETGRTASTSGEGRPFYPEIVTIPAGVNVAADPNVALINQQWQQRVAATDAIHPPNSQASADALRTCRPIPVAALRAASFQGNELLRDFPTRVGDAGILTGLSVNSVIQPTVEDVFSTIRQLGWNDLVFHTAGVGCFRGRRNNNIASARLLSNHGLAIAIDLNSFENTQNAARPSGSMDPRIVALFESFHFDWGKCFGTPDPMHFEYCGTAC